ncbi:cell envelope-related function transcriptional attenuator common domain-containing protein [Pisciglobus halotolerans]|uniref:Cell envelope-related function transcriptional attenuator common domain-containing protein n=1 Tax=Pisciglobus halotolerans TaxID=745365 RepID=A0A1I3BKQ1_9LACT|nr:cell envelope-related function transcriptional attenuator common domain-containing protein [Pisciglobus halotolerans]
MSFMIPILTVLLLVAVYAAKMFATAENAAGESYHSIDRGKEIEVDPLKDTISLLVMGVDDTENRNLGSSRTDSLIYLTIDPKSHEVNMVSIPRDTYTEIVKDGQVLNYNKINSAYEYGEEKTTIETVENLLDLPVHYYATFNFDAFLDIIDALGGIEMDVPVAISEQNSEGKMHQIELQKGYQTLNGEEALALARTRKIDNDVKRGERQQEIIQAIVKKALSVGSVTKLADVIEVIGSNMRTDMHFNDMLGVAQSGLTGAYTFHSYIFDWTDFKKNGASMVELFPDSVEYISHKFKVALDLEEPDERDAEDYQFQTNYQTEYANQYN